MDRFAKVIPTGTTEDEEAAALPDNAALLAAIHSSRETLEGKIGEVRSEVSLLRQDLRTVTARVTETETRISSLEDALTTMRQETTRDQNRLREVAWRVDDNENRARRNNLRFVGFPEGAEKSNCEDFLRQWLLEVFGPNLFSVCFVIERAHRAIATRPPSGAPPRAIIAKFLNFKDRDAILREAGVMGKIRYENTKIMAFQDYSSEGRRVGKGCRL